MRPFITSRHCVLASPRLCVRSSASRRLGGEFSSRRGFTLIDLLVAVTIIAILTTIGLGALNSARESARIAKTQATVAKLHWLIMNKYDSYRTRRLPISTLGLSPYDAALARVNAVRDLMRMEMPDRLGDIYDPSDVTNPNLVPIALSQAPAIMLRYRNIYKQNHDGANEDASKDRPSAELLYMIVSAIPGAMEQFHANEIGDVDGDTLPEFIDAWGNPIRFIRWPAGFYAHSEHDIHGDSEIQFGPDPLPCGDPNPKYHADPFDPTGVFLRVNPLSRRQSSFALFPLIFSAGPDGKYDINEGRESASSSRDKTFRYVGPDVNPFDRDNPTGTDPERFFVGQPLNDDTQTVTDLRHYDNIHNHRSP
ncbi:MAG TPA: hypothetical protein DD670_07685 [Planctomycetaceae bacterium]|nr:hypothetical protein [Planctomycetaceae bacterium]